MNQFDITIVGLGNVGLCTALGAAKAGLRVAVIDRQAAQHFHIQKTFNGLDIALAQGIWRWLTLLNVTPHLQQPPSIIRGAHVIDQSIQKTLSFKPAPYSDRLGAFVPEHHLRQAFFCELNAQNNVSWFLENEIQSIEHQESHVLVKLANQERFSSTLLVAADGRRSPTRALLGLATQTHHYDLDMICCRIHHSNKNNGWTTQRLIQSGSLATLPLEPHISSLAIALPTLEAQQLMSFDKTAFTQWLISHLSEELGELSLISERYCVNLNSHFAPKITTHRAILLGDAAIGMLPLTAHGLNLGLLGARNLIAQLRKAQNYQQDIGSQVLLNALARRLQATAWPLYSATNLLARSLTRQDFLTKTIRKSLFQLAHPFADVIGHWCEQEQTQGLPWINAFKQWPSSWISEGLVPSSSK